eukprot:gb/GECH01008287.1/.p1 GENE.gb/GECH01008287.1/~~gb/GECH01008287.1/.p1  ORF type:complete len:704 (+),score=164.86 gb/GECH01008287.1/:1-2112(+)
MHDFPKPTTAAIQKQKDDFLRIFGGEHSLNNNNNNTDSDAEHNNNNNNIRHGDDNTNNNTNKNKSDGNNNNDSIENLKNQSSHNEHEGIQYAYSKALTGKLRGSRVRGLCWKLFFGLVDTADPSASMEKHRQHYYELKNQHLVDPRQQVDEMNLDVCNPLSQSDDNPWQSYFAQEDLEEIVWKDLQRLFPEHELFAKSHVHKTLLRVLMVYALDHPDVSYRQGMHEILGGIYYAMASDAQCTAAAVQEDRDNTLHALRCLASEEAVEADCFLVFEQLMNAVGELFHASGAETSEDTPILRECAALQDHYLQDYDPCLANHLRDHAVEPQFYAIKWFRLLFGRDFHLEDVLVVWDAMFAEADLGPDNTVRGLPLMPHIAVAMLVYIRLDLLGKDNSGCLRRLMHYPPVEDVVPFVERARQSLQGKVLPLPVATEPTGDTQAAASSPSTPSLATSTGNTSHQQQQQQHHNHYQQLQHHQQQPHHHNHHSSILSSESSPSQRYAIESQHHMTSNNLSGDEMNTDALIHNNNNANHSNNNNINNDYSEEFPIHSNAYSLDEMRMQHDGSPGGYLLGDVPFTDAAQNTTFRDILQIYCAMQPGVRLHQILSVTDEAIDHRALITYGLVKGFLRRVHEYPMLIDQYGVADPGEPLPEGKGEVGSGLPERLKDLLDGTHCEDEICCVLEIPREHLIQLIHDRSDVTIVSK